MQSPTREEMMKLLMYDIVVDKNDASCECTIPLQKYKIRMMQLQMHKRRMMQVVYVQYSCGCTREE